MKIFKMNDSDCYAADTMEEAVKAMAENLGFQTTSEEIAAMRAEYGVEEPVELTDEDLGLLNFVDEEEDGSNSADSKRSFREQLALMIESGEEFPCFFASTEY